MPVLVVQLGHCHRTSGATGTTGEQAYATRVGNACTRLLHGKGGWSVRLILADAPDSQYRGDAFVAVHCDGSISSSARGASVGYRNSAGQQLGQAWKRAYEARGWTGFRQDNYTSGLGGYYGTGIALKQGNTRAVVLECGFRTNSEDLAALDGPGGPERVALAIGDALGITTPEEDVALDNSDLNSIWMFPCSGTGPDGKPQTHPAIAWITVMAFRIAAIEQATAQLVGRDPVDVDEAAVAANLAPMLVDALAGQMSDLGPADLDRIATAVADEQARRMAA